GELRHHRRPWRRRHGGQRGGRWKPIHGSPAHRGADPAGRTGPRHRCRRGPLDRSLAPTAASGLGSCSLALLVLGREMRLDESEGFFQTPVMRLLAGPHVFHHIHDASPPSTGTLDPEDEVATMDPTIAWF